MHKKTINIFYFLLFGLTIKIQSGQNELFFEKKALSPNIGLYDLIIENPQAALQHATSCFLEFDKNSWKVFTDILKSEDQSFIKKKLALLRQLEGQYLRQKPLLCAYRVWIS